MPLMSKVIALDAMGGDYGPEVIVPAAARVLSQCGDVKLLLVGQQERLEPFVKQHLASFSGRFEVRHATEVVAMDELPSTAMRNKKDSSMRVALNLVKAGEAQACVSAGNTGALMATARFVLKTLPRIDRPAITTTFPTKRSDKGIRILDLGANVDSAPEHLYQFAIMGTILSQAVNGIKAPRVALLNIGEEDIKGNELVKKAAELLAAHKSINYIGYIEANRLFDDVADVVVCDGFVGNVMLKTIEGAVSFISSLAKQEFLKSMATKLMMLPAKPLMKRLIKRVDVDSHNGAALLGLNGIAIKSHGGASIKGFASAIKEAMVESEKNIPQLIEQRLDTFFE